MTEMPPRALMEAFVAEGRAMVERLKAEGAEADRTFKELARLMDKYAAIDERMLDVMERAALRVFPPEGSA